MATSFRKFRGALIAVTLTVTAIVALWRFWPQPTLADIAESIAGDLYSSHPGALIKYAPKYEIEKIGLSETKLQQMYSSLVAPRLSDCKIVAVVERKTEKHNVIGRMSFKVQLPDGRTVLRGTDAEYTDDGPIYMIKRALLEAWAIGYLKQHPELKSGVDPVAATLWGLLQDRETLENLGFRGFAQDDEMAPATSIPETIQRIERLVKDGNAGNFRYYRDEKGGWVRDTTGN